MKRPFGRRGVQNADRAQALDDFVKSIALVTDPRALQNSITSRLRELAGCEHGMFCELNAGAEFRVTFSTHSAPLGPLAFPADGHLSNWLRVNRTVLPIPDTDGVWEYLTADERIMLSSAHIRLCVPLSAVNRMTAVVLLSAEHRGRRFDRADLLLLTSLARQAALAYDQTLLFAMQQERLQSLYRAEQLIVAGQLAATIAHEVKNPLATIRATLQYLSNNQASGVSHSSALPLLHASIGEVDRIDRTVRGLLNLSRPAQLSRLPLNVWDVLRDALLLVQVYANRHDVTISCDGTNEVLLLLGDPRELKQVFVNLLMNACESLPNGGDVSVAVRLSRGVDGTECAEVRVTDSGVGMSEEEASKAFDPFFTTKARGTGLGLAICLQIVSRHGGTIELQKAAQGGTVAQVTLPLAAERTS